MVLMHLFLQMELVKTPVLFDSIAMKIFKIMGLRLT